MKRIGAIICLLGALAVGGIWVSHGMLLATLTERMVEKTVVDDFGDEEVVQEWEPTFEVGLDLAIPIGGGLLAVAGVLLFLERRERV